MIECYNVTLLSKEDEIIRELESQFEVKVFLTLEDVTALLDCKPKKLKQLEDSR
jgi:hypothetical protein